MGVRFVANHLRTLESKAIVKPIGGYSGHRMYELGLGSHITINIDLSLCRPNYENLVIRQK